MERTVNEKLFDETIKSQVKLLRFTETERFKASSLLDTLKKEIVAETARVDPFDVKTTSAQRKRLIVLNNKVNMLIDRTMNDLKDENEKSLEEYAKYENNVTIGNLNKALGINVAAGFLSNAKLKSIINYSIIDGKIIGDWWDKQTSSYKEKFGSVLQDVAREVQLGTLKGSSLSELIKRVKGKPGLDSLMQHQTDSLIRTSFMEISNNTRLETYNQNKELFDEYIWISTLDGRTSPICRALDGKRWDQDFNPIGHHFSFKSGPPRHWGCRSTFTVVTKPYKDLVKVDDRFKEVSSDKRAAYGGPVTKDTDYNSWLKTQSKEVQQDVLGKTRLKLWKNNKLFMADMVHQNGRQLTLAELKQQTIAGAETIKGAESYLKLYDIVADYGAQANLNLAKFVNTTIEKYHKTGLKLPHKIKFDSTYFKTLKQGKYKSPVKYMHNSDTLKIDSSHNWKNESKLVKKAFDKGDLSSSVKEHHIYHALGRSASFNRHEKNYRHLFGRSTEAELNGISDLPVDLRQTISTEVSKKASSSKLSFVGEYFVKDLTGKGSFSIEVGKLYKKYKGPKI